MERRNQQNSNWASQDPNPHITVTNRQRAIVIDPASVKKLVSFFLKEKKISCQEVSVYFVGKKKICEIHGQFFQDPSPTDCMTFPMNHYFLGECVICPQIALEVNPEAPYEEISHYLIHCLLHLIGYEDTEKAKQRKMRKEEYRILNLAKEAECLLQA
ncbi:MAG: rRNA maturation RNase YbeY [Candidatus Rhabdochlamydia sp.]